MATSLSTLLFCLNNDSYTMSVSKCLILRKVSRLRKYHLRYMREEVKYLEVSFECYKKWKRTKAT